MIVVFKYRKIFGCCVERNPNQGGAGAASTVRRERRAPSGAQGRLPQHPRAAHPHPGTLAYPPRRKWEMGLGASDLINVAECLLLRWALFRIRIRIQFASIKRIRIQW
jgi:hypothetical protein